MAAIELLVSALPPGDIPWRLGMIRSLLAQTGRESSERLQGHCAALVQDITALPGLGPVAVVEFAGLMISGTPGGDVYHIDEDVPVGPATAYWMRALHFGDAT